MDTGKSSKWYDLIFELSEKGIIKSERVMRTMFTVDRQNYVPCIFDPYLDSAVPIGFGATISAPHLHALVLELLKDNLSPGARALDVGSGSGYLTACMAFMVGPSGLAIGIDHISGLVQLSRRNVLKANPVLFDWNNIMFAEADGRLGYLPFAPYDVINVGAATQNIPSILTQQLAPGGRLVIPVGNLRSYQFLMQVDKRYDGKIFQKKITAVKFVPLTDITAWGKTPSQITLGTFPGT